LGFPRWGAAGSALIVLASVASASVARAARPWPERQPSVEPKPAHQLRTLATWPAEPELRVSARPAVYGLDRASVAGLGSEGEVWLGWRAGDSIAAELS